MQLVKPFDAKKYNPTQGVGSLPIGRHPVIIESSEVKANKANDGGYLQLNLRIIDGPHQGATGVYRLNLYHSNQQVVEIAHRQLSAICHVIGVFQVTDSSQLHNLPFLIEVGPQKNDPQYTEVKKVFDMNGNEPGKAGVGASAPQGDADFKQQQPAQQPAGGAAWGWQQQPAQQPAQQPHGAPWGDQSAQQQPAQGGGWQQSSAPASTAPWNQR